MIKGLRVVVVAMLALVAGMAASNASAQMMHFTLNVVIETSDGGNIPAGQVCVSGEVDPICQDIPADTPSGREFSFPGLADGEHDITVNAEPYLEAVDHVTITELETTVTITLEREETPVTPEPNLPNTGVGPTQDSGTTPFLLITGLLGAAGVFVAASAGLRRKEQ
jgi:hypothetical protein